MVSTRSFEQKEDIVCLHFPKGENKKTMDKIVDTILKSSDIPEALARENSSRAAKNKSRVKRGKSLLGPISLVNSAFVDSSISKSLEKTSRDKASTEAGILKKKKNFKMQKQKEIRERSMRTRKDYAKKGRSKRNTKHRDFGDDPFQEGQEISSYFMDLSAKKLEAKASSVKQKKKTKSPHPNKIKRMKSQQEKKKKKAEAESFRLAASRKRQAKKDKKALAKVDIFTESGELETKEGAYLDWHPSGIISHETIVDVEEIRYGNTAASHSSEEEIFDDEGVISRFVNKFDLSSDWWNYVEAKIRIIFDSLNLLDSSIIPPYIGKWLFYGSSLATLCLAFVFAKDYKSLMIIVGSMIAAYGMIKYKDLFIRLFDKFFHRVWKYITKYFSKFRELFSSDSGLSFKDRLLIFLTSVVSGDFFKHLAQLFTSLVSMKLFNKDFGMTVNKVFGKKKMTIIDGIIAIIESLLNLYEMTYMAIATRSLRPFVGSDNIAYDFINRIDVLIAQADFTYAGNPIKGYICQRQYYKSLIEHLSLGEEIINGMYKEDKRHDMVKAKCMAIQRVMHNIEGSRKGRSRIQPYGLVLAGPPGIGKSKLVLESLRIFAHVRGREFSSHDVYSKPRSTDYFEGYDPISHPYIHYPEVGNVSKDMIGKQSDRTLLEINSLSDSLPFSVDRAFEDKGKVFAAPEMLIIDTNNLELNAKEQMFDPKAIFRRFDFIQISVLPEFRKDPRDTRSGIDPDKSFSSEREYLDKYKFEFMEYKEKANTRNGKHFSSRSFSSLDDFRAFIIPRMQKHMDNEIRNQELVEEESKEISTESGMMEVSIRDSSTRATSFLKSCVLVYLLNVISCFGQYVSKDFPKTSPVWALSYIGLLYFLPYHVVVLLIHLVFLMFFKYVWSWTGPTIGYFVRIKDAIGQIEVFRNRAMLKLKYVVGKADIPNPLKLPLVDKQRALVGLFCSFIIGIVYSARSKIKYSVESSEFKIPTKSKAVLETWEEKLQCGKSYERIPNKQHKLWANVRKVIPKSAHTGDALDLDRAFNANIRTLEIVLSETKRNSTRLFGIKGSYALVNKHAIPSTPGVKFFILTGLDDTDFSQKSEVKIDFSQTADVTHDAMLINIPSQRFKDVTKHLMPHSRFDMELSSGSICGKRLSIRKLDMTITATNHDGSKTRIENPFMYTYPLHFKGMCGTPLYVNTGSGSSFMGIHAASDSTGNSYAVPIDREMILRAVNLLSTRSIYTETASISLNLNLQSPKPKSLFRYEKMPGVDYYGYDGSKVLIKGKSNLVRSAIHEDLNDIFSVFDFERSTFFSRPIMKPTFHNGEYLNPYNLAARKMGVMSTTLDPKICRKTIKCILDRLLPGLEEAGVTSLTPLDVVTAINGADNDAFIRRINPRTSAGHGWTGLKSEHIPLISEESVIREPTEDLARHVVEKLEKYMRDESEGFIFKCQLKDEPRELSKVAKGKTRVFYMMSVTDLIISRMFLAPIYSLMVEHGDLFGTAVGINMHTEADKLVRNMSSFSEKFMEGDYSNYDQTIPPDVAHMASTIVYSIAEHFGYSPAALKILQGILSDNIYPVLNMLGDYFSKCGNQPSGKYATAEDNSLRGLILLVYAFNILCDGEEFFECVRPLTYGDDLVAAIKPRVQDRFNNHSYRDIVIRVYGMGFTAASKEEELKKFLNINEISFLKRKFVKHPDPEMDIYIAPLDMNSLYKALEWNIPSSSITSKDQLIATSASVLWESYFHSKTIEQFSDFREKLVESLCSKLGADTLFVEHKLPTYTEIHEALWNIDTGLYTESSEYVKRSEDDSYLCLRGELFSSVSAEPASINIGTSVFHKSPQVASPERDYFKWRSEYNVTDEIKGYPEEDIKVGMAIDAHILSLKKKVHAIESYLEREPCRSDSISMAVLTRVPEARTYLGSDYRVNRIKLRATLADLKSTISFLHDVSGKRVVRGLFTESGAMGEVSDGMIDMSKEHKVDNVTDIGGEITSDHMVGVYSEPLDSGQYNLLDMDGFFSRPVEISTFTIPVATAVAQEFKVWDLWSLNPAVRAKFRNFAYFRGNLKVKIAISGTPFHYGRILCAYCPFPEANATLQEHLSAITLQPTWKPLFMNYLSQQKGRVTINVNENKPVVIDIPFIAPKQMFNLYNNSAVAAISDVTSFEDFAEAGSLFLYTLNDVGSVTATPSDVSVQVYAWAEDVSLGVPTGTVLAVTTESGSMDEREVGPVENFTTKVESISKALEVVPFIRPFAMASTLAFKSIKAFASIFGWSYPVNIGEITRVRNQPLSNGANTIGFSTAKRITLDPKQELTVDPSIVAMDRDELLIRDLAAVESFFTTFTWASTDTPLLSDLFACRVNPNLVTHFTPTGLNPACQQPTAMAWVAQMFQFWRGTLKFRIEIVCSAYHRGKIAIVYEPNVRQAALIRADIDLNKQYVHIVDIQETQSFEFCIDWASPRPWQQRELDPLKNFQSFSADVDAQRSCNGFIYLVPFTTLQSPDDSDVEVNVYASCEDLRVNYITSNLFKTTRDVVTESGDMDTAIDLDVTCFSLNPTSASEKGISTYYFGEEPLSLRSLLKRFTKSQVLSVGANASTTKKLISQFNIYPDIQPAYGGSSATYVSFIGYLRYAFLAMKGGVRKRMRPALNSGFIPQAQCQITLDPPTQSIVIPGASISTASPSGASINGTVTFVYDTNGGIEYELPYYSPNLFAFSPQNTYSGVPSTMSSPLLSRAYTIENEIYGSSDAGVVIEESATAEDFMFMRFIGAPFYSV